MENFTLPLPENFSQFKSLLWFCCTQHMLHLKVQGKHRCTVFWSMAKMDRKLHRLESRSGSSATRGQVNIPLKEWRMWFHMARGDALSENTDSNGICCEREQRQIYHCHWLCTKNTRWNADITVHWCRFQQPHSSTNEILATLFNQP